MKELHRRGMLPRDKDEMIDAVRKMRQDKYVRLDERPLRGGEGAIINWN